MLTYQERLERMTKEFPYQPRHCKLASKVLTSLCEELERKGFKFGEDSYWPYHILVPYRARYISFSCSGFSRRIDIMQLTKVGLCDHRFREVAFNTPIGAANWLARYLG